MKQYFKKFGFLYGIVIVLTLVSLALLLTVGAGDDGVYRVVFDPGMIWLASIFVAGAYLVLSLASHRGKKTTTAYTYVENGAPTFNSMDDIFVTKRVTSRKIEKSGGKDRD